jgi:streptomycin 6-kinase
MYRSVATFARPFRLERSDTWGVTALCDQATETAIRSRYGSQWVAGLALLVKDAQRQLNIGPVRTYLPGGTTASVTLVDGPDGQQFVLKVSPDVQRAQLETAALTALAHAHVAPMVRGGVPVHAAGLDGWAMLLELVPGAPALNLHHVPGDGRRNPQVNATATQVAAALVHAHRAGITPIARRPGDPVLPSVPVLADYLRRRIVTPPHVTDPWLSATSDVSRERAMALLEALEVMGYDQWVHGSCHPGNVLVDRDRLWLIDPRPMIGDPLFDVAEFALKAGSQAFSRRYNMLDGMAVAGHMRSVYPFALDRVEAWMQVALAAQV